MEERGTSQSRVRGVSFTAACTLGVLVSACNAFDEPTPEPCASLDCVRIERVVPTDYRIAVSPPRRPPPVSGGTLLVTSDKKLAVVADSDRDRLVVVDLTSFAVKSSIQLEPGDEPGRLVEDAQAHVHVALRGAGSVVTLDPAQQAITSRRSVCAEPRGLAVDPDTDRLLVACAEGLLTELALDGEDIEKKTFLGADLRDVAVIDGDVYVSRFRSAELLKLDSKRNVVLRGHPPDNASNASAPSSSGPLRQFEAGVAWRMIPSDEGVVILHQRATIDPILVEEPLGGASYSGGNGLCDGIVEVGISRMSPAGVVATGPNLAGAVLAVDVAVSADLELVAVAQAGVADAEAPTPFFVADDPRAFNDLAQAGGSSVPEFFPPGLLLYSGFDLKLVSTRKRVPRPEERPSQGLNCIGEMTMPIREPVVAVAFDGAGHVLALSREPSTLFRVDPDTKDVVSIPLGGATMADTGHELFHRDAGAGIACASCHPEGGDDAHVWNFDDASRRTQALNIGLAQTAPFHWAGDLPDIGALMRQVFVGRMGGVHQSNARLGFLTSYLNSFKRPAPARSADDPIAERGRLLFESEAGCAACHSGASFTNNETVDVGTGEAFQVPSLIGVSRRAPYLHDGCASSLADRFTAECGGAAHGDVSWLSDEDRDALVAYLETL